MITVVAYPILDIYIYICLFISYDILVVSGFAFYKVFCTMMLCESPFPIFHRKLLICILITQSG